VGVWQLVVLVCSFLTFAFLGIPIFIGMGLAAVVYCTIFWGSSSFITIAAEMVEFLNNFAFLCVPFFVLAGELMNTGGITRRLVNFSTAIVGHISGGLSHVNIIVSMVFSGVSGSAVADTSAVGSVLIPAMKKEGYPASYAAAVTAASSTIGPIIPPSIPLVFYGMLTEQSIGKLFLAGAIPGMLVGIYLLVASYLISKKRKFPARPRIPFRVMLKSFFDAALAFLMPLIIVGGIVSGIVTPTEAGVLAVVYSLIVGLAVYRELKLKDLLRLPDGDRCQRWNIQLSRGGDASRGDLAPFFHEHQSVKMGNSHRLKYILSHLGLHIGTDDGPGGSGTHVDATGKVRGHRSDSLWGDHRPQSDDRAFYTPGGDCFIPGNSSFRRTLKTRHERNTAISACLGACSYLRYLLPRFELMVTPDLHGIVQCREI
jgi:hypothetical protein